MVFVTGGTGLLGSHLITYLLDDSHQEIIALYRHTSDFSTLKKVLFCHFDDSERQFKRINFIEGDLFDLNILEGIMQDADTVYHCAAKVSFDPYDKTELMRVNVEGVANIVNAALKCGVKKLCHVSSTAALGRSAKGLPIDENTIWEESRNNSVYAVSKYKGELEVWRGIAEGLNAIIVNPALILGAGNFNTGSPKLFKNVAKGFPFYTTGINAFVDVKDVVRAMIILMKANKFGQRYCLNGTMISYQNLFTMMAKYLNVKAPHIKANHFISEIVWRLCRLESKIKGKKPLITKEMARTATNKYSYSSEKIIKEIGFQFTPIEKTIKDICQSYLISTAGFML